MGDDRSVVVVGGTNVGKTTFFAVLDRALRDQGFALHASGSAPGSEFLYRIRDHLTKGYFPPATATNTPPASFRFTINGPDLEALTLSFVDPPGEVFQQGHSLSDAESDVIANIKRSIRERCERASAMLVLIDLNKPPEIIIANWRYTLEQFVNVALNRQDDGALRRIAVVFTKADVLSWQARSRQRFADGWLAAHPDLSPIYRDAQSLRPMSAERGSTGPTVGFFFASAIGWAAGAPNCRTVVRARELTVQTVEKETAWEDLIPDPARLEASRLRPEDPTSADDTAQAGSDKSLVKTRSGLARGSLPLFSDPTRLVESEIDLKYTDNMTPVGVLTLPGRQPIHNTRQGRTLSPWNIVEPLFWAAREDRLLAHSFDQRTRIWDRNRVEGGTSRWAH